MKRKGTANIADFQRWLRQSLGRAALFIQEHPPELYREALLYACQHNLVFDWQSEDARAPYLFRLVQLTGEVWLYRSVILTAPEQNPPREDRNQMNSISRHVVPTARTGCKPGGAWSMAALSRLSLDVDGSAALA